MFVMILYDVMAEGYHTPLTCEEIATLYHAGRIGCASPCKLAVKAEWRTVDELFPLLKHDQQADHAAPEKGQARRVWLLAVASLGVILTASAALAIGWRWAGEPRIVATAMSPSQGRGAALDATAPPSRQATSVPGVALPVAPQPRPTVDSEAQKRRWEQERLAREQLQREQAAKADRLRRENEREAARTQLGAGTDTIIPLDTDHPVNVGGYLVKVRVHDNDVTSFDIWVDGRWYHNVKKEKGISGSQTDETFIYRTGRAALYYVWELSGKLNHCRLRVREN